MTDLAAHERVRTPTTTVAIRRLEKIGLVKRSRDPSDLRAVLVDITPRGRAVHGESLANRRAALAAMLSQLPESDLNMLMKALAPLERLGCSGEVVVTDLFNHGFPFIRYANGDMATMSTRVCACGRCLPMLDSVDGRVLDAIITANGHRLPGEFFPHMLKDVPGLLRFQLVQRELERLDLSIVRGEDFDVFTHPERVLPGAAKHVA